jgi:hypothetical protein
LPQISRSRYVRIFWVAMRGEHRGYGASIRTLRDTSPRTQRAYWAMARRLFRLYAPALHQILGCKLPASAYKDDPNANLLLNHVFRACLSAVVFQRGTLRSYGNGKKFHTPSMEYARRFNHPTRQGGASGQPRTEVHLNCEKQGRTFRWNQAKNPVIRG